MTILRPGAGAMTAFVPKDIADPIELLILSLPFAALATVMIFALTRRARRISPELTPAPATVADVSNESEPVRKKPRRDLDRRADAPVPTEAQAQLDRIRAAVIAKDQLAHAAARVALGDVLQRDGDLTTACEHWQIARAIYADAGVTGELEAVEARMRKNGCPTDWVLNDF